MMSSNHQRDQSTSSGYQSRLVGELEEVEMRPIRERLRDIERVEVDHLREYESNCRKVNLSVQVTGGQSMALE